MDRAHDHREAARATRCRPAPRRRLWRRMAPALMDHWGGDLHGAPIFVPSGTLNLVTGSTENRPEEFGRPQRRRSALNSSGRFSASAPRSAGSMAHTGRCLPRVPAERPPGHRTRPTAHRSRGRWHRTHRSRGRPDSSDRAPPAMTSEWPGAGLAGGHRRPRRLGKSGTLPTAGTASLVEGSQSSTLLRAGAVRAVSR